MGTSKESPKIYTPEDKIFELYDRIDKEAEVLLLSEDTKTRMFERAKIDDIEIEMGSWKIRGTTGDFDHNTKNVVAWFYPVSPFDPVGKRELIKKVYEVLKKFYGEPSSEILDCLIYNIKIGTRGFVDKYHDGRVEKGEISITRTIKLKFDYMTNL